MEMSDTTGLHGPDIVDCLKTIALDGSLLSMDSDGMCLMEIDDFSDVAGRPWASLWPLHSQVLVTTAIQRASGGKVARFSADCPTAKGAMKSWDVSVVPVRNDAGEIIALQSLSHDVTRREHDKRETAIVSRELAHRIKNLFAVVDSLIHLSGRSEANVGPFVDRLRQRLQGLGRAIAYIHPMDDDDVAAAPRTVKGLVGALVAPYEMAGANIEVSGDDADVDQNAVTSLAMVLNELATNAVKYGAMKTGDGSLSIRLSRNDPMMTIQWDERETLLAPPSVNPGFGMSLLDRTMKRQLGGTIARDWTSDGLKVRLEIPLARLAEA